MFVLPVDGTAQEPDRLTSSPNRQDPAAWSPDGEWLVFCEFSEATGTDLMLLHSSDHKVTPWLRTGLDECNPAFSADGRFVAYISNSTDRSEVWVRPFPGPGAPTRVSVNGGQEPRWSRSGNELFYQEGRKLMAAEVASREPLQFKPARMLFEGGHLSFNKNEVGTYDVGPDGRFLMITGDLSTGSASLVLVQNWVEELKRSVPYR